MLLDHMLDRALRPGCQGRYAIILEGDENLGKTETVRSLGGSWSTELSSSLDSLASHLQLKGSWLIELGELDSVRKSEVESVNRFISARFDEFIPKYANDPVKYPRRCTFIGTTNKSHYLKSTTGDTRWFPIKVLKADYHQIAADRDMLFAEAKCWYEQHVDDWWKIPDDVMTILQGERDSRREPNPFEERLSKWLDEKGLTKVTWLDIVQALNLPADNRRISDYRMSSQTRSNCWAGLGGKWNGQRRVRNALTRGTRPTTRRRSRSDAQRCRQVSPGCHQVSRDLVTK